MAIYSNYLSCLYEPTAYKKTIRRICQSLEKVDFDGIAFRGVSGTAVGFAVAAECGVSAICVRKPGDGAHTSHVVEGSSAVTKVVILDDFVESGATVTSIVHEVLKFCNPKIVGLCFYADRRSDRLDESSLEWKGLAELKGIPIIHAQVFTYDKDTGYRVFENAGH